MLQSLTIIILFLSLNKKRTLTLKREPVTYLIVFIINLRLFLLTSFIDYNLDLSLFSLFTSSSYIRVTS
jgi:hypothetical protein